MVVISPHLDDGVFACGALIARLARRRMVVVVTVFAGSAGRVATPSEWDRAAGFPAHCDAVAARRAEDRAALARLRARPCWLPYRDSQYGASPRVSRVAKHLFRLLPNKDETVLFPLGLFHSDHVLAREAALAAMARHARGGRWLAYEDALYRCLPGLRDAAVARLRRAGLAPHPARFAADADAARRKAAAVDCYRSQLRALSTPGRPGHADALAQERYWWLSGTAQRGMQ